MKIIVPVNVCVQRHYRMYVKIDEGAGDSEIRAAALNTIIEDQDSCLNSDPDIWIEEDDVGYMNIDHDGAWTEEDDEEIREIMEGMK